jgi:hypothetical protein
VHRAELHRGDLACDSARSYLTPNATVTAFVEFWVAPVQLFRPAADNDHGYDGGSDSPGEHRAPVSRVVQVRAQQYFQSQTPPHDAYPWTQLGYTYDWGTPTHHQGMSEFVIRQHSTVIVNAMTGFSAYCRAAS